MKKLNIMASLLMGALLFTACDADRDDNPVIDLTQMTTTFFQTMGEEDSKKALVHYPANTFPGQDKPLADNTHFNTYGAWETAKMVVMGLKRIGSSLADHLRAEWQDFDPAHPDDPATFVWQTSSDCNLTKPDGN